MTATAARATSRGQTRVSDVEHTIHRVAEKRLNTTFHPFLDRAAATMARGQTRVTEVSRRLVGAEGRAV
jgi:hypothetical protein